MTDSELFLLHLRTLRDQLSGSVGTIDSILVLAERASLPEEDEGCVHPIPLRRPMPTMGHPSRFLCGVCHATVEE